MRKIEIFYRHCQTNNIRSQRPVWFNHRNCFLNLLNSIDKHRHLVNLTVYFDGDPSDDFIMPYKDQFDLITVDHHSSLGSWLGLHKLLKQSKDKYDPNTVFYLLENDYLHQLCWVDSLQSLYSKYGSSLNYVSLYDHNDKYFYSMYNDLQSKIYVNDDRHWRTVPSTCASFLIDYDTYYKDTDVWLLGEADHPTFVYLTSHRKRQLLTPMPSLSTHCMVNYLAPTVDWESINASVQA